jgi:hypothetical protein
MLDLARECQSLGHHVNTSLSNRWAVFMHSSMCLALHTSTQATQTHRASAAEATNGQGKSGRSARRSISS